MVTYSSQGLQNLVHVIFHEVEMMESNDYFSNQNKYIFRKKKWKFMLKIYGPFLLGLLKKLHSWIYNVILSKTLKCD
jgi:hypothetical protein